MALQVLRESAKSLYWLLWLILASFLLFIIVQWGAGGGGTRSTRDWAARVDGETIPQREFLDAYERQENLMRQFRGTQYDRSRDMDPEKILDAVVSRTIARQEARAAGFAIPDEEVAAVIRREPTFQGDNGRFDRASYDKYLEDVHRNAQDFEEDVRRDELQGRLSAVLAASCLVPRSAVEAEYAKQKNTTSIEYVLFPSEDYAGKAEVSDAGAKARYDANPHAWDGGPARRVRFLLASRDAVQAKLENDAELKAWYDQHPIDYTIPADQRRARVLLVGLAPGADAKAKAAAKKKAEGLAARVRGGADFAALAREVSDDEVSRSAGGDTGPIARGAYDPVLDDVFFGLKKGEIKGPVETSRGYWVVQCTKADGAEVESLADVRAQVAAAVYGPRVDEAVKKTIAAFQDAFSKDANFDAAAKAAGVEPSAPRWMSADDTLPELGGASEAVQAAFALKPGQVTAPVVVPTGQAILLVMEERETSPRTFDEARADVTATLRKEGAARLARDAAEKAHAAAESGKSLAEAAPEGRVQTADKLRPASRLVAGLDEAPQLVDAAFATPAASLGPLVDLPKGTVLFRVTETSRADPAKDADGVERVRHQLEMAAASSLTDATVEMLRADGRKIESNEDVLRPFRTTGRTSEGG